MASGFGLLALGPFSVNAFEAWSPKSGVWSLSGFFYQCDRLVLGFDDFTRDHALAHLLLVGQRIHEIQHEVLDDHAKSAGANLPLQRRLRDRFECIVREPKLDVLVFEQLLVLTRDG